MRHLHEDESGSPVLMALITIMLMTMVGAAGMSGVSLNSFNRIVYQERIQAFHLAEAGANAGYASFLNAGTTSGTVTLKTGTATWTVTNTGTSTYTIVGTAHLKVTRFPGAPMTETIYVAFDPAGVIGNQNTSSGTYNFIKGNQNLAAGNYNVVVGNQNNVSGNYNTILGNCWLVSGNNGKYTGTGHNCTPGAGQKTTGPNVIAGSNDKVLSGTGNLMSGNYNCARGSGNIVSGNYNGCQNQVPTWYSVVLSQAVIPGPTWKH